MRKTRLCMSRETGRHKVRESEVYCTSIVNAVEMFELKIH